MKRGYDRTAEETFDRVDAMAAEWPKDIGDEYPGTPYGAGRATDEEFALLFEEKVNGRIARDPITFAPVIDPMTGAPVYAVPPDPWFTQALLATHEGEPIVEGGLELLARYERVRMGVE